MDADLRRARFGCDGGRLRGAVLALGVAGKERRLVCQDGRLTRSWRQRNHRWQWERYFAQRQRRDAARDLLLKMGKLRRVESARI